MKLKNLRIELRDSELVALVADVESIKFGNNIIWVSVPKEYESWLCTNRYDGFLVALLYPAMSYGEDIEIDGTVSKRLLRNITKYIQEILLAYDPELRKISVVAKEISSEIFKSAMHIGTGFSGGVDSFSTIYNNFVKENDKEYKIDTLFNINAGTYGPYLGKRATGIETEKMFQSHCKFLKQYPESIGLPFIVIDSNIHFYHKEWSYLTMWPLAIASGILAIQKNVTKYYVASAGYNYDEWIDVARKKRGEGGIASFSEPYLFPLLCTESLEFICDGLQYSRAQKTLQLTDYELAKKFLNICIVNEPQKKNCGICNKCARVGMTLSIVNKLADYAEVFDVNKYRKNQFQIWSNAIAQYSSDSFMKDIIDFAKKADYKIPSYYAVLIYANLFLKWKIIIKQIISKILGRNLTLKLKRRLRKRRLEKI